MIIRELSALFSFKYNPEGFKKATSALDNFAQKANMILGAVASHYALQTFFNAAQNIGQAIDKMNKSSSNLGISTQAFQELSFAAKKSGIEVENFEESFKELMLRSRDAVAGGGDAAQGFKALGVSVRNASGRMRDPIGLLEEVADKIKSLPTQSDKIWALDKLFGDPGYRMLTMLGQGSEGLKKMRAEAHSLGVTLDNDAISRAQKFNQSLKPMKSSSQSFASSLMTSIMPGLTAVMNGLTKLTSLFNQLESKASAMRVILIGLGLALTALVAKLAIAFAPAIVAMAPMIAAVTAIGSAIGLAAMAIEDLLVAFRGGDSVFKNFYEKIIAIKDTFKNLVPDFLKSSFSAKIGFEAPKAFSPSSVSHLNNTRQNQQNNITVAVNVKSGANPQEIGSEVSKLIRKELEKERTNAFMGISNYAL